MPKDKTPLSQAEDDVGAVEAYNILQRRQMNEDRILAERTSMFLVATSFLFAAFVVLLTSAPTGCIFKVLGIILSSVGITLTVLLYIFNRNAIKAVTFWHDAQAKIEFETSEFEYMRQKHVAPHLQGFDLDKEPELPTKKKESSGTRPIYKYCLPITFGTLWIAALAVSIARIVS